MSPRCAQVHSRPNNCTPNNCTMSSEQKPDTIEGHVETEQERSARLKLEYLEYYRALPACLGQRGDGGLGARRGDGEMPLGATLDVSRREQRLQDRRPQAGLDVQRLAYRVVGRGARPGVTRVAVEPDQHLLRWGERRFLEVHGAFLPRQRAVMRT